MIKLTKQEIEEIKSNADDFYWYGKNVFEYEKNKKWTLVENDKLLVKNADYIEMLKKDIFIYKKYGKWTLIKDGKVLIRNTDWIDFDRRLDVFIYKKDGKETLMQNGKTVMKNVDRFKWYEKDAICYIKKGLLCIKRKKNILNQ